MQRYSQSDSGIHCPLVWQPVLQAQVLEDSIYDTVGPLVFGADSNAVTHNPVYGLKLSILRADIFGFYSLLNWYRAQ